MICKVILAREVSLCSSYSYLTSFSNAGFVCELLVQPHMISFYSFINIFYLSEEIKKQQRFQDDGACTTVQDTMDEFEESDPRKWCLKQVTDCDVGTSRCINNCITGKKDISIETNLKEVNLYLKIAVCGNFWIQQTINIAMIQQIFIELSNSFSVLCIQYIQIHVIWAVSESWVKLNLSVGLTICNRNHNHCFVFLLFYILLYYN